MKMILYVGILAAVLLNPLRGTDVGKLIPVEVITVAQQGTQITVETDTGDRGIGNTLEEAFQDMEDTAPGVIYLDTAEYLLIEEGIEPGALRKYLKGSVRVCTAEEGIPLEGISDFLSAHEPGVRLKELAKNSRLPTVTEENGRYRLDRKYKQKT